MKQTTPHFRRSAVARSVLVAIGAGALMSGIAQAQSTLERVTVTGSAIKRSISDESSLPITILDTKELRESGVTSVEEAMSMLSSNQSSRGSNQSIGSGTGGKAVADLRGLGSNKTLVLLNGRRLASFAFDAASVDLNAIPLAAISRIEILRDGASAIYGTDAIGGVINFITKRDFRGGEVSVEATIPKASGGREGRFSLAGGVGNLDVDGFNVWAALDRRTQAAVAATEREFAKTGVDASKGLNLTSGTTFPGNFTQGSVSGNPTRAAGCLPPFSLPLASTTCRFDYTAMIDIVAPTETTTATGRANFKLGSNLVSLELLHSENKNTAYVAPDPVTGITLPPTSPFYPKTYVGIDPTKNITAGWRTLQAGRRTNLAETSADRFVATISGAMGNWDYDAGTFWTQSKATDGGIDGYVNAAKIKAGVASGALNPFGEQTAAGLALINDAKMIGNAATGKGTTTGVDFHLNGEVFSLPAGKVSMSFGAEVRKETYENDTNDAYVLAVPSMGRDAYHAAGDRNVMALTLEALVPVTKQLELQLAARRDQYSDFGSTFNPKIGFRYQPNAMVMVRGSANTGFRAPTLDDLYGPQSVTFTANSYDDPLLCPNGVVNTAAGGIAPRDCGQQFQAKTGGNTKLQPETSVTGSLGIVLQPMKDLTLSVDYWKIKLKDQIAAFPETAVVADPVKYANRIIRCSTLSIAVQDTLTACQAGYNNGPGIGYIETLSDNLGAVNTDGFDFAAQYGFKAGGLGGFTLSYNGTLVNSYQYQNSPTDPFKENVGIYQDASPVFKWMHVLGLNHKLGAWSTQLTVMNKSSYKDQDVGQTPIADVAAYTLTNLSTTYSGVKGLALTVGVKNLFDVEPPLSVQATTFQKGYDPRYTDAIGRALFLRANYKF
ncbi:MAG: TonB-dependent receptor [Rhodoferax sp.]|nr:TonB-dependent receptor [Rhodoferax sp.]MCF8210322.1 TonB-dependent receptor [Rhodoferax sp.]